ncbi:MAG: DUF2071 domain-containing protein [Gemmataceae bacterium]
MSAIVFPPRPRVRLWDVTTTLADFAIITYAVEPAALAALLPVAFEPDVFTLGDGRRVAFVSAVPFHDLDFRFGFAPWLKFRFGQTNYRAYVTYRGERCVWFFGTSLATHWVLIPRYGWKLPWHHARLRIETVWAGERCVRYHLAATGAWGNARAELAGSDTPMGQLDGFADAEETALVLTHPLTGYYQRRDGRLGSYSVWHERLDPRRGTAGHARFEVFEALGLVTPETTPHSVLLQRRTEFIIRLPPRRLGLIETRGELVDSSVRARR